MYAKIYESIFDSSIADDYEVRHVFEDLLKLADQDGVVNRTQEAIARRTNVPIEIVKRAIGELEKPDARSQSKECGGRRLVRLDPGRDWGWRIVNHGYYRALRTAEEKRQADRERQRRIRGTEELTSKKATVCDKTLQNVTSASAFASVSGEDGSREGGPSGNGSESIPAAAETPTLKECQAYAVSPHCGFRPDRVEEWFEDQNANRWKYAADWKARMRADRNKPYWRKPGEKASAAPKLKKLDERWKEQLAPKKPAAESGTQPAGDSKKG